MGSRFVAAGLVAALLAVPLLAALAPVDSGDAWWHLAVGRRILETGRLVTEEPFSHTAAGHPFTPQEWLSQVVLAGVDGLFGLTGVRILTALLLLAGGGFVWRQCRREGLGRPRSALVLGVLAPALAYGVEPRPHMFSFVLLGAFAQLVLGPRPPSWRAVAGAGFLATLWANFHAVAVLAPLLAGAAWLEAALARSSQEPGTLRRRFAALVATGGAVALNPSGLDLYRYAFFNAGLSATVINEWTPLWFSTPPVSFAGWPAAASAAAATGLGLLTVTAACRGRSRRGGLQAAGFACLILRARRWLWLGWLPAVHGARRLPAGPAWRRTWTLAAVLLAALPLMHPRIQADLRAETWGHGGASPVVQPLAAADFLQNLELEGNLYHPYVWGGYLLYRLSPAWKPYLYGETAVFMEAGILQERQRVELGPEDEALEILERRRVRAVVLPRVDHRGRVTRPPEGDGVDAPWIRVFANRRESVWLRRHDAPGLAAAAAYYQRRGIRWNPRWGFLEHEALLGNLDWCRRTDQIAPASFPAAEAVVGALRAGPARDAFRQQMLRFLEAARFSRSARVYRESW